MEPLRAYVIVNPLSNCLATAFFRFIVMWIFGPADPAFVAKIFTIKGIVIVTFIVAPVISIIISPLIIPQALSEDFQ